MRGKSLTYSVLCFSPNKLWHFEKKSEPQYVANINISQISQTRKTGEDTNNELRSVCVGGEGLGRSLDLFCSLLLFS